MTDIILDGGDGTYIVLQGRIIQGDGVTDFILNAPERRNNNNTPHRALVHDFKDILTINYNHDYAGGVIIRSNSLSIQGTDLVLDEVLRRPNTDPQAPRRALVHNFKDGLTINWANDYPGGVVLHGDLSVHGTVFVDDVVVRDANGNYLKQLNPNQPTPPIEPIEVDPPIPPQPQNPPKVPGMGDQALESRPDAGRSLVPDVQSQIASLQEQITALQATVTSLQQSAKGA